MQVKTKKRIFNILKIVVAVYCLGGIALWELQDKILLHPKSLPAVYVFPIAAPHEGVTIQLNENDQLHFIKFFPADTNTTRGVVLYFHGNRDNINRYASYADNFTKHGYEVWMPDYPGFGKTTGVFTEERLYNDAGLLYKMVSKRFSADSIILYGRSLGTGVASELATHAACKRLILETPYYSFPSLAASHFPIYPTERMMHFRFPVFEYIPMVKAPVTVFHGTKDEIIPYRNSLKLKGVLKKGDEYIVIEKGKHNNLNDFPFFHQKLDSLLKIN